MVPRDGRGPPTNSDEYYFAIRDRFRGRWRAGTCRSGFPCNSSALGTITRFGWKAQNKSITVFAGEAYNVEMGINNELFPTAVDENPNCAGNDKPEPNDVTRTDTDDSQNQGFT